MIRFVGWSLVVALVWAVSVGAALSSRHAFELSRSIDSGSAQERTARLDAWLYVHEAARGSTVADHVVPDEWKARFTDPDGGLVDSDGGFNVPGRGDVLHRWDGHTVTCYMSHESVIGVRLPDGTVLKSDQIGLRGAAARWVSAVLAFGIGLVLAGVGLRAGRITRRVGVALSASAVLAAVHLQALRLGIALDVAMLVAAAAFAAIRLRRPRSTVV